jgi:2-dehydro-3-deoxyphosphogluconate aldolase/(4S)-4-hydroxy-2-oxoglutarate aldolase
MAFSKQQIISEMKRTGLVPLWSHENEEIAFQAVKAAYDSGIRAFEFTNRKPNSLQVFKSLLSKRSSYPELMLGIGTVMDAASAKIFIDAGADFIISPILKTEMASVCHAHDKLWIPGSATLTEIVTAKEHGAEVIKVFPGSVLGPGFISAIMPVVPGLQLMVTGGVEPTRENLSAWFKAGVLCVGLGSQLFSKDILEQQDWNKLKNQIAQAVSLVQEIKNPRA